MASLLQNAGEELLQNIDPPVNITAQAWKYIDAMRSSQDAKGWLGPVDNPKDGNTYVPSPVPARAHAVPQARGLGLRAI